jgi:DNA repair photolyase
MEELSGHTSRKGCGCFYTHDWGEYPSKGGYPCPHKCLYCYAKHNIVAWGKVKDNVDHVYVDLMSDI